jgi:hypothetical protein
MLSRLALRLAAVEALCPAAAAAAGPYPTIAGPRVYDSRQDPIESLDEMEQRPLLLVYTEQSTSDPYPKGNSSPDATVVLLVVEALIAAKAMVTVEMQDGSTRVVGELEAPIMERDHEALLDLLEATVRRRLEGRYDVDAATQLFRKVAWDIHHVESVPMRDATKTVRLAGRTLTFRVKIPTDRWAEPSVTPAAPTGLDRLPEPLRTVALAVPETSSARAACDQVADLLGEPDALAALGAGVPADGKGAIFLSDYVDRGFSPSGAADMTTSVTP